MFKKTLSGLLLSSFIATASFAQAQDTDALRENDFSLSFDSVVCDSEGFTAARIGIKWKDGENSHGIFPTVRTRKKLIAFFAKTPLHIPLPTVAEFIDVWSEAKEAMRSSNLFCPKTPKI